MTDPANYLAVILGAAVACLAEQGVSELEIHGYVNQALRARLAAPGNSRVQAVGGLLKEFSDSLQETP